MGTMAAGNRCTVLQYTGCALDVGGVLAVVRALAGAGRFRCILGAGPRFTQCRHPHLHLWRGPPIEGESIGVRNALRALVVAWRVRRWLRRGSHRVFHGHSRAGLLVALWLAFLGERRVVATVHAFGRRRWFYRWAARRLGDRLHWLDPAMKRHYRIGPEDWRDCLPDCVPDSAVGAPPVRPARPTVVFGCAGSLVPVKQWEIVLHALARVPRAVPVRVVHVGGTDGSAASRAYAARMQGLSGALGAADRIEWRGASDDMMMFFREIDCLIVASRWEASSVAALEAIAAGVPVLAPDASGTRDLVERCHGGWLFRADSASDLAAWMMRLALGRELADWRRDEAAVRGLTATRSAADHAGVYEALEVP